MFASKGFKIRLRLHQRASRTLELPGPLSGPWTPAERDFALRARDVINSQRLCDSCNGRRAGGFRMANHYGNQLNYSCDKLVGINIEKKCFKIRPRLHQRAVADLRGDRGFNPPPPPPWAAKKKI